MDEILRELIYAIVFILVVYLLLRPLSKIRDLTEVGYEHVIKESLKRGKCKKEGVREAIRKRKIGQLPPIYPNGWFAILDSNELKKCQIKYVSALGEDFAVFRSNDGLVHILDAYCPHMGANIAIGGSVSGNCIKCPFHGWTFDGATGNCIKVPYSTTQVDGIQIKCWCSREVNSYIFVWYHAENESPNWNIPAVGEIENSKWWFRGRREHFVNCHIQEIPENGADVMHLESIHEPPFYVGSNLEKIKNWKGFVKHKWQASWTANEDKDLHIGKMYLTSETEILNRFKIFTMSVIANQIGPGYVVMNLKTTIGPMIILQTVTPVDKLIQKVTHKIFYPLHMYFYATIVFFTESIMFERDVGIWNNKRYLDKPMLTTEERSIKKHRIWYSQFYSKNSPRFLNRDTLDW